MQTTPPVSTKSTDVCGLLMWKIGIYDVPLEFRSLVLQTKGSKTNFNPSCQPEYIQTRRLIKFVYIWNKRGMKGMEFVWWVSWLGFSL